MKTATQIIVGLIAGVTAAAVLIGLMQMIVNATVLK